METTWTLPDQTAVKHFLLRSYLDAWFPILGTRHNRLIYLDGFAGPGCYEGGEEGSPIIALKSAKQHLENGTLRPKTKVLFLFVEADEARANHLESTIAQMDLPNSFEPYIEKNSFAAVFDEFLDPRAVCSLG